MTPRQAAARSGPLDRLLEPDVFKALGDPVRALLLRCIAKCGRGCSVSEVAQCCSVDLSVVSRHLAVLARVGVLEASREGRTVRYRVRFAEVSQRFRRLAEAFDACCPDAGERGCCGKA